MKTAIAIILIALLILIGCTKQPAYGPTGALAQIFPTQGNNVTGWVSFEEENNSVRIIASISGLSPGPHGFHIHEFGNCTSKDGSSAGGHFNPENTSHGAPTDEIRHAGDLGNIIADETGKAYLSWTDAKISFAYQNFRGKSVIIHEKEDDLKTQPTGAAGARLGCGIINDNTLD